MPRKDVEESLPDLHDSQFVAPDVRRAYELLGVKLGAPESRIRRAYHRLATLTHPDHNPDNPRAREHFEEIQQAYEIATNPDRMEHLNRKYLRSIRGRKRIGGRLFDPGSFYGIRRFTHEGADPEMLRKTLPPAGGSGAEQEGEEKIKKREKTRRKYLDEERSILDLPEWDVLEILLGGRFRDEDYRVAERKFHEKGLEGLEETPWVLRNLDGYRHFAKRDFRSAANIYRELNRRIPHNLIFIYREALSREAHAWTLIWQGHSSVREQKEALYASLQQYEKAIHLGENRPGGEQQFAISIRKSYADLLEALGYRSNARRQWRKIMETRPYSVEGKEKHRRLGPVKFYFDRVRNLLTSS